MDRDQLETTAVNYPYLRGLLAVPLGILFILSGVTNMEWVPSRLQPVLIGVAIAAAAGYVLLGRFYQRNYGRVTPRRKAATFILGNFAALVALLGGPIAIDALNLPLNGLAISWALVVLAYYSLTIGLKRHHVVIWGAVLVAGLLPLWGDPATTNTANAGLVIAGVGAIATGIFDHRVLVHMFESHMPAHEVGNAGQ
jgi:hypothetical protein